MADLQQRVEDRVGDLHHLAGRLVGLLVLQQVGRLFVEVHARYVVGGALDGVTSLLEARLLGVGLQAGGSLVGGGLAAEVLLARCCEGPSLWK